MYINKLTFIAYPFWCVGICCIKVSVLTILLRIKNTAWWRRLLWSLIALSILYTAVDCALEWALFSRFVSYECVNGIDEGCAAIFQPLNLVEAIFPLMTDITISFLPIAFLIQLRRPFWEKFLIGGLISLGLVASAFSICKINISFKWRDQSEELADLFVAYANYSAGELFLGIVAASLFGLKATIYGALKERLGMEVRRSNRPVFKASDETPENKRSESTRGSASEGVVSGKEMV